MAKIDEQIYPLVKQWCDADNQSSANEALRQIAIITGCMQKVPNQLTEPQKRCVLQRLESNYPNAYLWAISQRCVGHPAMVWGLEGSQRVASA